MAGEARRRRLRALLRLADVTRPGDLSAIEAAFVHESFARERGGASNERLEFLGDSVLGYVVASWLFANFSGDDEGILTARKASIVNDVALARTAARLHFGELLELGTGLRNAGGAANESVLADAFEAFVAALYLRYGEARARAFVEREHAQRQDHAVQSLLDAKTRLQHLSQERWSEVPVYTESSLGTAQSPRFSCVVSVNGKAVGRGEGRSKKAAQQEAATAALAALAKKKRNK